MYVHAWLILTYHLKWTLHPRFISFICSHSRQTYNWSNFLYLQHNASHPWGWNRARFPTRTSLRAPALIAETSGRIAHGEWITDSFTQRITHKSDATQIRKFDHISSAMDREKRSGVRSHCEIDGVMRRYSKSTWPFTGSPSAVR